MRNDEILSQISEFCRQADMAESTFGRRAVNDGKLVHRLREGKRICTGRQFMRPGSSCTMAPNSRSSSILPLLR